MEPVAEITPGTTPETPSSGRPERQTEVEATPAESALPVPVGEPRQRHSLWRRITRRREPSESGTNGFQDLVKSRLDGITLRLEAFENGLARSEARLETRFALMERLEKRLEALADLGELTDQARDAAHQAADAARRAANTARLASALAGVALVIAISALTVTLN